MTQTRSKNRISFAFLLLPFLYACGSDNKGDVRQHPSSLAIPADEATAEERKQIDSTLLEIETLAGELGRPQSFRSLPIVVSTESMAKTERAGACYLENGRGRYILVNRVVLREEERLVGIGLQSTLFRVLLHEIGHCYFGRDHLEDKLSERGRRLRFPADRFRRRPEFSELNVSSMESRTLLLPIALKKYYVAEILGLFRARSLAELAQYTGADF